MKISKAKVSQVSLRLNSHTTRHLNTDQYLWVLQELALIGRHKNWQGRKD